MSKVVLVSLAALLAAGCMSVGGSLWPAGMQGGQFSRMSCDGGKTIGIRPAEDGKSVRVRALHGSAELERKAAGHFAGEGYEFKLDGAQGASLMHNGKPEAQNCRVLA